MQENKCKECNREIIVIRHNRPSLVGRNNCNNCFQGGEISELLIDLFNKIRKYRNSRFSWLVYIKKFSLTVQNMGIMKTRRILTGLISVVGCYLSHLFTYIVINRSHGFSGDSVLVVAIRESRHCYITPLSLTIPVIGAIVLMILTDKKQSRRPLTISIYSSIKL